MGGGFHGILDSPSTRLPGLVSIADVAPTAVDLEQGTKPVLGFRPGNAASLRELDRRLTRAHDSRAAATAGLAALLACLTAAAFATRSRRLARAALLAAPAAISIALLLSAADVRSPLAVGLAVAAGGAAAALVAGRREALFAPAVALFLAGFLVVLAAFPETNALAAIGPHPDGGVRFFGVTNQVETLLLAPVLAAAATSRRWLVTVGLLAPRRARLEPRGCRRRRRPRAARRAGCARRAGRAPARLRRPRRPGGSRRARARASPRRGRRRPRRVEPRDDLRSAVGLPGLADDLGRRLDVTWAGATASWHAVLLCVLGLAALLAIAVRTPRHRVTTAFLVALAVSLVVNDSPVDELVWGALGATALLAWENASSARRSWSTVPQASPAPSRLSA